MSSFALPSILLSTVQEYDSRLRLTHGDGSYMDYTEIFRVLKTHWKMLVVIGLLGSLAGSVISLTAQRDYVSSAQVFVVTSVGTNAMDLAQGGNYSQQQAKNYSNIVKSELVLQPVITALSLDLTTNALARKISTSVPLSTSIISVAVTDTSSERAAQIANSVISSLASRVSSLSPTTGDGLNSIRMEVIQTAVPPSIPASPNVKVNIAAGIALGILLGGAFVVIRNSLNSTIQTNEQVREITQATMLGWIGREDIAEGSTMLNSGNAYSAGQEQIRQIRTNVTFLQPEQEHKLLVITSSVPDEGKSSVSTNLAISLASLGKRVCLVDADLRKGTLARILDLEGSIGLTTVLSGQMELSEALQSWGSDNLTVLLSGAVPPNASELLSSTKMKETIDALHQEFEVVIIDTPPVLPVTDGVILGQLCEGVVLVVGAGRVNLSELKASVEILQVAQTPILGTIFNLVNPDIHPHSRGSYSYGQIGSEDISQSVNGVLEGERL